MCIEIETRSEEETKRVGEALGQVLQPPDLVCIYGDLGAGKTVFIKGIARALDVDEREITSASFVIIAEHEGKYPFYHIDLYRLSDETDVSQLGLEDYLDGCAVAAVEWPEFLKDWTCSFEVTIQITENDKRKITIVGDQQRIEEIKRWLMEI